MTAPLLMKNLGQLCSIVATLALQQLLSACAEPALAQGAASGPTAPTAPLAPATAQAADPAAPDAGPAPNGPAAPAAPGAIPPGESLLGRLSRAWAKDDELSASGNRPVDDLARCPRAARELRPESAALVPASFVPFEAIPTHACDEVLRVFLGCTAASDDGTSCTSWTERLVLEPVAAGPARLLGNVDAILGANAGGLFVPFAFTRDDGRILLRAWMFPPGAGGGAVDYGVGVVARSVRSDTKPIDVQPLPVRDPKFYADLGCAIGLAGSPKTPTYTQPGFPSNNGGALVAVDLATLRPRTLLEERDTTYSVDRIDEKAGTLDVHATKHTFSKDCPREDGALSCSMSSAPVARRIALPACRP